MRYLPLVLIAVLAFAPAAEAGSKPSCSRSGSDTVASNSTARVYTKFSQRAEYGDILYGCLRRTGRHVRLAENYDDDLYVSTTFSKVRLNGRFVVWQFESIDVSCKADCPSNYDPSETHISVADLGTRRVRQFEGEARTSLFVTRGGTPAWLQDTTGGAIEVHAGAQILDSGAIDRLKLTGNVLGWTNAGTAKSATLR
jgi:hypothetical protein